MFNSLTGTVTGKFPKKLFVQTQALEWDICVPDSALDDFAPVGKETKVFLYLNHYEDGMDLYGFPSEEERSLFFDLLKVDGIGPKGAIKILSSVKYLELVSVLESGELDVLEKIPGVGKKTAAKMLLALKGKLSVSQNVGKRICEKSKNSDYADVITSLTEMGYERVKIEGQIASILEELKSDEEFLRKSQTQKEDFIFKKALMDMSR